jgi:acetyltransferase-like isoleucine patch superfamily enzyme
VQPHEKVSTKGLVHVGRYTYGAERMTVINWDETTALRIGNFCSIAKGVRVLLGGDHRVDWVTTFPFGHLHEDVFPSGRLNGRSGHPASSGDVTVRNDCWIGSGATLLSGATLSDGSVLGASAVLAGPTEPYGIYVGNPARLVRKRFPEATIAALLEIRWWDWPDELIDRAVPLLQSEPTSDRLEALRAIRSQTRWDVDEGESRDPSIWGQCPET